MTDIVQDRLGVVPWMAAHTLRLPGTAPVAMADWLQRDEALHPWDRRLVVAAPRLDPRHPAL